MALAGVEVATGPAAGRDRTGAPTGADRTAAGAAGGDRTAAVAAGVRVHPAGLCESDDVGAGTRVWAFAHVLPGAVVGRDCNVCDGAFIEGGARVGDRVTVKNGVMIWDRVTIEDDVFLGPGVVFTNDLRPRAHVRRSGDALVPTVVRQGATLGAGAVVVCGIEVGAHAFAAAGAVVTRDVAAHAFVAGNPARQRGWVCTCGERLDEALACSHCGRRFARADGGLTDRGTTGATPDRATHGEG